MSQIGLKFEVISSNLKEDVTGRSPSEIVMELAEKKAEDVFEKLSEAERYDVMVIGADTVVAFENQIMGKPQNSRMAAEMLVRLQGKTHQVYTGVSLLGQNEGTPFQTVFFEKTDVTLYPMDNAEILEYINTGEAMDKAGAYGIQGRYAAFVKEIQGDYNNVVGLPLGRLYHEIKKISGRV